MSPEHLDRLANRLRELCITKLKCCGEFRGQDGVEHAALCERGVYLRIIDRIVQGAKRR